MLQLIESYHVNHKVRWLIVDWKISWHKLAIEVVGAEH